MPVMTIDELHTFFEQGFGEERPYRIDTLEPGSLRMGIPADKVMLRPGGTISGPTLMGLADAASYALILAHIGPVSLAVTSSLHISFLHKPPPGGVAAHASFLKLGRTLAVVDVRLVGDGPADIQATEPVAPVAQATVTYVIPR